MLLKPISFEILLMSPRSETDGLIVAVCGHPELYDVWDFHNRYKAAIVVISVKIDGRNKRF